MNEHINKPALALGAVLENSTYALLNLKVASQLEVHRRMLGWLRDHAPFLNTLDIRKCDIQEGAFLYIDVKYSDMAPLIKYFNGADWIVTHSKVLDTYGLTYDTQTGIIVTLYFVVTEGHIETHVSEHGEISYSRIP